MRPDVDVKIEFTGLRPGEKLYEELFDDAEERMDGGVEGIFVAISKSINLEVLRRLFDELQTASGRQDHATLLRLLAHAVPSYRAPEAAAAAQEPVQGHTQPLWGYGANRRLLAEQS